eukprot:2310075-Rhodomonas_salina.1
MGTRGAQRQRVRGRHRHAEAEAPLSAEMGARGNGNTRFKAQPRNQMQRKEDVPSTASQAGVREKIRTRLRHSFSVGPQGQEVGMGIRLLLSACTLTYRFGWRKKYGEMLDIHASSQRYWIYMHHLIDMHTDLVDVEVLLCSPHTPLPDLLPEARGRTPHAIQRLPLSSHTHPLSMSARTFGSCVGAREAVCWCKVA